MKTKILLAIMMICSLGGVIATAKEKNHQTIDLSVTEKGFEPKSIDVAPGSEVTLKVTRKTDSTCATQVQVPSKKIKVPLPLNQTVTIALGKLEKGEVRFGCGMSMMEKGRIVIR